MNTKLMFVVLSGALMLTLNLAHAEMYKVYVKRAEDNLYIDTSNKILIKTKYCYEYTYGSSAILVYEKYSYSNKLVFENGSTCEVESVSSF